MKQRATRFFQAAVLAALFLVVLATVLVGCVGCNFSTDIEHLSTGDAGIDGDAKTTDGTLEDVKHDVATPFDAPSLDGFTIKAGCNPLAIANDCMLPYPSDLLTAPDPTTPTGLRMALPPNSLEVPDGATPILMGPFNRGDGAPTSSPILVHFGVEVGASYLADQLHTPSSLLATSPIALMNATTGERVPFLSEMDANDPTATTRHALIIRPLTPLAFGTRYVVVLTTAVKDTAGRALPPSLGFAALRDKITTSVASLEAARPHFEELFTFLAAHGFPRDSLQLAWDYTTVSSHAVIGPISVMRQEVFHSTTSAAPIVDGGAGDATVVDSGVDSGTVADANFDAGPGNISYTIDSITASPYVDAGAMVIEGNFTPPNYLQPDNTIVYTADNVPVLQTRIPAPSYPYTMIVPSLGATQSLNLLVFGHGLFGDGRDYLTTSFGRVIQPLAQELGTVVIATDWIGLSNGDLQLILNDVVPDLNRVGIVTDRLLQALVNNLSLIELSLGALENDPRVKLSQTLPLIDPAHIYYYGVSLGGIEGSSFISVSRNITRAAVAVPGASWSNLLARSYDYQPIELAIEGTYPDKLLQQEFITLMQSRFDPADPINLATLFKTNPLPNSPASRIVLIQESIDDCQVPNLTTEMLARAYNLSQVTPDIVPIFGLPTLTTPTTENALSQFELTVDVAIYVPPLSNVTPAMDNGAHFDLAFQPPALAEVTTLMTTGSTLQSCDGGPCVIQ
jgi:hypothetical protein